MALGQAIGAAVGQLTVLRSVGAEVPRESRVVGLALYPVVGLALGALAAGAARGAAAVAPALAPVVGVLALEGLTGGRPRAALAAAATALVGRGEAGAALAALRARPAPLGTGVALAALGVKLWALASIPPAARTTALVLAPLLGRWAMVVQCYGGASGLARGPAAALVGRARFQEFAWASLVAFALTLSLAEAVGLVLLLTAALTTLAVRLRAHRRLGGLTGRLLAATGELVETAVLVVLGALAALGPVPV
jgi:adenosylcobinamide-GDP ribazoletransferase